VISSDAFSNNGKFIFFANFKAPSATIKQCEVLSFTFLAKETGFAIPVTHATAP